MNESQNTELYTLPAIDIDKYYVPMQHVDAVIKRENATLLVDTDYSATAPNGDWLFYDSHVRIYLLDPVQGRTAYLCHTCFADVEFNMRYVLPQDVEGAEISDLVQLVMTDFAFSMQDWHNSKGCNDARQ